MSRFAGSNSVKGELARHAAGDAELFIENFENLKSKGYSATAAEGEALRMARVGELAPQSLRYQLLR
mgnify:CR=1 FL=1